MPLSDYYAILGLKPGASQQEIRKAYLKLAKQYHPDRHKGDPAYEEKFKQIQKAYEMLTNPQKRRKYDFSSRFRARRQYQHRHTTITADIRIYINKRVVSPGEPFELVITCPAGARPHIEGLENFDIIDGPLISTGFQSYRGRLQSRTVLKYTLAAKHTGYIRIGPVRAGEMSTTAVYIRVIPADARSPTRKPDVPIGAMFIIALVISMIVAIAVLLHEEPTPPAPPSTPVSWKAWFDKPIFQNGEMPHVLWFGKGIYDENSPNYIRIVNHSGYDAIFYLVEADSRSVVRHAFVADESRYVFRQLPDGKYFTIVYAGKGWNPHKPAFGGVVSGGFETETGTFYFDTPEYEISVHRITIDNQTYPSIHTLQLLPPDDNQTPRLIIDKDYTLDEAAFTGR